MALISRDQKWDFFAKSFVSGGNLVLFRKCTIDSIVQILLYRYYLSSTRVQALIGDHFYSNFQVLLSLYINSNISEFSWVFFTIKKGVAGMVSKTSVAPLDRIKILLQVHHNTYKHFGKYLNQSYRCKHDHYLNIRQLKLEIKN